MRILEIKNNLVKISYTAEDNLAISGFVIIEDKQSPYVAQVMSLKADNGINYAIVKLLFTFDSEGVVKNYNGTIPELDSNITKLAPEELLDILPIENPFPIGKLAQRNFILNIDYSTFENDLLVCSDNNTNSDVLLSNIAKAITSNNDKSIIFDTTGTVNAEDKLVFGKDFKLPLNKNTINFIYEHDLNDISPASKALIQDILIEVQEYSETLIDKFIPFEQFLNVIVSQAKATEMPELAILKSRLLKYKNENVFAQNARDIHSLRGHIRANLSTVLDISDATPDIQNLIFSTVYDELNLLDLFIYSLVKIDNDNTNKRILKRFLTENKIFTTIFCSHNYRYIHDLKEIANNVVLFTPQTVQHDFGSYNVFLNKLNSDEAIILGKATQNIPLIIEMMPIETLLEYQKAFANEDYENSSKADTDSFAEDTYSQESMMVDSPDYANSGAVEQVAAQILGTDASSNSEVNIEQNTSESADSDEYVDNSSHTTAFTDLPEVKPEQNNQELELQIPDLVDNSNVQKEDDVLTTNTEQLLPLLEEAQESAPEQNLSDFNADFDNFVTSEDDNNSTNASFEDSDILDEIAENVEEVEDTNNEINEPSDIIVSNDEQDNISDNEQLFDDFNNDISDSAENSLDDNTIDNSDTKSNVDFSQENSELLPEIDDALFDNETENSNDLIPNVNNISENILDQVYEDLPQDDSDNLYSEDALTEDDLDSIEDIKPLTDEDLSNEEPSLPDESSFHYEEVVTEDEKIEDEASGNGNSQDDVFSFDQLEETENSLNLADNNDIKEDDNAESDFIVNEFPNDELPIIADEQEQITEDNSLVDDIDEFTNTTQQMDHEYAEETTDTVNNIEKSNDNNDLPNDTPVVPIYSAEDDTPVTGPVQIFDSGDKVQHPKYGEGVVEKMVKFGNKVLCSINFPNGRRLLDPTISQLTKIN